MSEIYVSVVLYVFVSHIKKRSEIRVFEKRLLRRKFGPRRENVA
jgi:hypothetical protein